MVLFKMKVGGKEKAGLATSSAQPLRGDVYLISAARGSEQDAASGCRALTSTCLKTFGTDTQHQDNNRTEIAKK